MEENIFEIIAHNLKILRKRSKLPIQEFCDKSGLAKTEYYKYIKLKHKPGLLKLQAIAENNEIKLWQLLKKRMR